MTVFGCLSSEPIAMLQRAAYSEQRLPTKVAAVTAVVPSWLVRTHSVPDYLSVFN